MKKQKNENVSYLSEVLDKLKEHKMAMAGLVVLIVEILMVVFLPMILKLDPYTSDYTAFPLHREERTSLEQMLSDVMFLPV